MTANAVADLVKVTTATTGTGTITLGSAVSGFRGSSALTDAKVYSYGIFGSGTYELGFGTYTASGTTLTRAAVSSSSNSNAAVSLAGGETVIVGDLLSADLNPVVGLANESTTTVPTAPSAAVQLFTANRATQRPAYIGAVGPAKILQSDWAGEAVAWWAASWNTTTISAFGGGGSTSTNGTAGSIAAPTNTNLFTSRKRTKFTTAASTNSIAIWAPGVYLMRRGNAAGAGGFDCTWVGGIETYQSGMGFAMGLNLALNFLGNGGAPSSNGCGGNSIYLAKDAADTTMQLMTNDGAGTSTKTDLGANFPANTGGVDLYELRLWCAPNGSVVYWSVLRINTGHLATGSISSDLPTSTSDLYCIFGGNTLAGSAAIAIAISSLVVMNGGTGT